MTKQKILKIYAYACVFVCAIFLVATTWLTLEQEKMKKQQQSIEENTEEIGEKNKVVNYREKGLKDLDVIIPEVVAEDKQFADVPWVKDRVQLPNSGTIVSLDKLRQRINTYNVFETQKGSKPLDLTAEDIINLCSGTSSEKSSEYNELTDWYDDWFFFHNLYATKPKTSESPKTLYKGFAMAAHNHYKDKYGKPFIDKSIHMYTAEETDALVKWTIDNVDYEYLEKIKGKFDLHKDSYYYGVEKYYFEFLLELGVITEDGKPIKP